MPTHMLARRWLLALIPLAVVGLIGWWVTSEKDDAGHAPPLPVSGLRRHPESPEKDEGFVGSEACRACHSAISEQYASHPMSRSLASVGKASALEDWGDAARFTGEDGRIYYAERSGEDFLHHERLEDADGKAIYDQSVRLDFAMGSGRRGRTYFINHGGPMCQSSLGWYANGGRWALSPGYDDASHPRFSRRASVGCLVCHSGRVAVKAESFDQFLDQPFHEESIGCERCHGPGADHIAWHNKQRAFDTDPIVNPRKLDTPRREAVCNQCHLQGEQRVTRLGQDEDRFRPGMFLSDVWISFLKTGELTGEQAVLAVSQFEQMRESRCYQQSEGQLGCTSCHSPHSVPQPEQRDAFYRERCLKCHTVTASECALPAAERMRQEPANSCVSCHMSRLSAADVPHTSQTDHRVSKLPLPVKTGAKDVGEAGQTNRSRKKPMRPDDYQPRMFVDDPDLLPQWELDRALGIFLAEKATDATDEQLAARALRLLDPVLREHPQDVAGLFAAGRAYHVRQEFGRARHFLTQAIKLEPQHEWSLELLAIMQHESQEPTTAIPYYEQLVEINPWRPEYHGRYAHVLGLRKQFDVGIQEANRALELNPTLLQTHHWLSQAYRQRGNTEQSQKHAAILKQFQEARQRLNESKK